MPVTPLPSLDRTSPSFKTDLDTFFLTKLPAFSSEVNAVVAEAQADADAAAAAAETAATQAGQADAACAASQAARDQALTYSNAAAAATAASGAAPEFVAGTDYAAGSVVYSPLNFMTYRCAIPGVKTIDPSLDADGWRGLASGTAKAFFLASF